MAAQDDNGAGGQAPDDAGVAFRAEMAVSDFALRYWPYAVGLAGFALVSALIYGQYAQLYVAGQRDTTAAIADVERDLPALGMASNDLPAEDARAAADKLIAVADAGSGPAAVEALLKAAELYRSAGAAEPRRQALERAAAQADGVLEYAATVGLANLDLEAGAHDAAIGRLKALAAQDGFLAGQALLDLAGAYEALGRSAEAVSAYDDYLRRFPEAEDVDEVQRRKEAAEAQG